MGVSTFTSNGVNFNFAVLKKKDEFYYEIAVRQQARIDLYFGVGEFNSITMLLSVCPLGHLCRIFMMFLLLLFSSFLSHDEASSKDSASWK